MSSAQRTWRQSTVDIQPGNVEKAEQRVNEKDGGLGNRGGLIALENPIHFLGKSPNDPKKSQKSLQTPKKNARKSRIPRSEAQHGILTWDQLGRIEDRREKKRTNTTEDAGRSE